MSFSPADVAALFATLNSRCDKQLQLTVTAGVAPGAKAIAKAITPQLPPTSFARLILRPDFATLVRPSVLAIVSDSIVITAPYRNMIWQLCFVCDPALITLAKGLMLTELQFAWDTFDERRPQVFPAFISWNAGVYTARCTLRLDVSATGASFAAARDALQAALQASLGTRFVEVQAMPDPASALPITGVFA
jgi:hypothetical protein